MRFALTSKASGILYNDYLMRIYQRNEAWLKYIILFPAQGILCLDLKQNQCYKRWNDTIAANKVVCNNTYIEYACIKDRMTEIHYEI